MKDRPQKINRINYIVQENPEGVASLLDKEGIEVPGNLTELIWRTKEWVSKNGKPAIMKLLQEHPEKDLLLSLNQPEDFDQYSGCGCKSSFTGGDCGCQSSFANHQLTKGGRKGGNHKKGKCKHCAMKSKQLSNRQLLEGLQELRDEELLVYYQDLKEEVNEQPDNSKLKEQLEISWEYIRGRLSNWQEPKNQHVPNIVPQQEKKESQSTPTSKKKKSAGNAALFSISTKEFAIGGMALGIALLIAQFKS